MDMLTDDKLKEELDMLATFEGRVGWMYQDNAEHPNVTTGVGYLLASADAACKLPWLRVERFATEAEVRAEFHRVASLPAGMLARSYMGSLWLRASDIDAEGVRRLRGFLGGLPGLFPNFESFPDCVQQCLLDLAWNVGLAGLSQWSHLIAACNSTPPDWSAAFFDCHTANPNGSKGRAVRNAWRSAQFEQAMKEGLRKGGS
jgi:hypothetical protein